ncbi:phosphohydrolase [Gluconacetobacter sacchari DSM 12717]|uniref:NUDIX hydrolase n=2 Tax=Gluconacetobacter sacchari TaxID=92759 RepID=A0A7W4NS61_9PROT|nr:NUDIX hydrolase [Gluconacetobacter sacchari]MBB2160890.1 NUDIX hydrolase [Gluconacetobacter sacchari]GBQ32254.1 phosphohydrolase [Gluconacetobacter sacchari DSM 12717]
MSTEPDWLAWAREIQAIAQTGLTFAGDPFDRERYEALRTIAARMMAAGSGQPVARIEALFADQEGYATPKVEVRAAVFDDAGRILMVREVLDNGRWTLPGGWADVNLTPAENAVKEVREESGYIVTARRLAAVWDRDRQGHEHKAFSCAKFFFLCDLAGGEAATSIETSEIAWFGPGEIPADLSLGRVLPAQIRRMFDHYRDPGLPADFE